ncbi:hypothetical protein ABZ639_32270 [Saccharomonospora sp. NPDC006951]
MNGRADFTEYRFATPQYRQPNQGRHRRAQGAETWTPAVPAYSPAARALTPPAPRERRHVTRGNPLDTTAPTLQGLPLPQTRAPQPRDMEFAASRGELPLTAPAVPPPSPENPGNPALGGPGEQAGPPCQEKPSRRKKVTLTTPCAATPADDEVRVYVAPPPDGLGKFDLGSVPASVTPPRSWRKAAWFATLSSGGVVVALLVAGTMLVSQPPEERQAIEGWTDRGGNAPLLPDEDYADDIPLDGGAPTSGETSRTREAPAQGEDSAATDTTASFRTTSPWHGTFPPSGPGTEPTGPGTEPTGSAPPPDAGAPGHSDPSTQPKPQKPQVTQAPMTQSKERYLLPAHDADTIGQRSQDYLNTVTEDPATAHEMTTGELAAEGTEGLRQKYADIAYFEVKHVYIDQNEGYTVNSVEVTHLDGSKTQETRKLIFGDGSKIAEDGQ